MYSFQLMCLSLILEVIDWFFARFREQFVLVSYNSQLDLDDVFL